MYPSPLRSLNMYFKRVDQVLAAERHHGFRHVLIKFAVDAEPADAPQAIAVFVERTFSFEQSVLRLIDLWRIARTQPGVNTSAAHHCHGSSALSSASVLRMSGSLPTLAMHVNMTFRLLKPGFY